MRDKIDKDEDEASKKFEESMGLGNEGRLKPAPKKKKWFQWKDKVKF